MDTKLRGITPGLVKLSYSYKGNPQQELAWKVPFDTLRMISLYRELPNEVLAYRFWLRDRMKSKDSGHFYNGEFSGSQVRDEHIERVEGRIIFLNNFFSADGNLAELLVPLHLPYRGFSVVAEDLHSCLKQEGFDVDNSRWDDYKTWEQERLTKF